MDGRTAAAESKHTYPAPWSHNPAGGTSAPTASSPGPPSEPSPGPVSSSNVEYFPFFFPQQATLFHHQQLLQYNKLVSPGRGGGQPQPPAQATSSPHSQSASRSRSGSKVSNKDQSTGKGNQGGHGNSKPTPNSDKGHRAVIANKDAAPKMPPKNPDIAHPLPARPAAPGTHNQNHSSSVPSTPLQRARNFSFESRDPSPNAANSHSPRSAYSETTAHIPQLKQLPPRTNPCRFETAQLKTRRRIPYTIGNEKLGRVEVSTLKPRLTEDEERKLTTDMRELYDRLLPTPEVEAKRKKLCVKLEKIFNEEWPGHDIRVHPFGSSGNLLCSDDSDVDICITTDWKELEGVCIIAELLNRRGMENVTCISGAKVPIVKIWDPELRLPCDMNVNNTVALENTRMVRTYVEIDDRVRQLAMIVKYWTRRRIVNDAGLGATLSSYTWICLVIAFLQLRDPPMLPALHQRKNQRLPGKDGAESAFADDLDQLRGFGKKNKSTLGQLLFDFFRFFAHEFDYDKYVLSVRLGRLLTKKDKNWQSAANNGLCLEEPFNITRNLGNTADEYSFKGLHLELRRAFDLISDAKLDECCEKYEFPKEEERVFTQTRKPQPVLMRSSSQTHSNRGGRGGFGRSGRHSNNFYRGNNSNRRASSSIGYDNGSAMFSPHIGQDLSWYTGAPYIPQDLVSAAFAMQVQQHDLRLQQLYQNQFLAQAAYQQSQQQQSSQSQPPTSQPQGQRMPGGSTQSTSDRSRTNSFDNPPLTAPLRPEMLSPYGVPFHGQQYFPPAQAQPMYSTFPSTPSATAASSAEFRRSLHRSSAAAEAGASAAGSTLRSQSQPASRSLPTVQANGGGLSSSGPTQPNGISSLPSRNNANGIPIPSFVADETEYDEGPAANGTGDSPPSEDGSNMGSYLGDASSPGRRATNPANGIAFGDLHQPPQGRRRMSTDLPQAVLDKRMKRVSRSPSPAGHARAFSVGNPPAPAASSSRNPPRPLVVSSSLLSPEASGSQRNSSRPTTDAQSGGEPGGQVGGHEHSADNDQTPMVSSATTERSSQSLPERPPIVVNGTNAAASSTTAAAAAAAAAAAVPPPMTGLPGPMGSMDEPSFRERISMMNQSYFPPPYFYQPDAAPMARHTTRQRGMPRQHNGVIAPLDLAVGDYKASGASGQMDLQNLSPVYEGKAPPSASTSRKPKQSKDDEQPQATGTKTRNAESAKAKQNKHGDRAPDLKQGPAASRQAHAKTTPHGGSAHGPQKGGQAGGLERQASRAQAAGQESGMPKSPKSPKSPRTPESRHMVNGDGGWQKASGKHRKKGGDSKAQANGVVEKPPKHESERKGG